MPFPAVHGLWVGPGLSASIALRRVSVSTSTGYPIRNSCTHPRTLPFNLWPSGILTGSVVGFVYTVSDQ